MFKHIRREIQIFTFDWLTPTPELVFTLFGSNEATFNYAVWYQHISSHIIFLLDQRVRELDLELKSFKEALLRLKDNDDEVENT